MRRMLPALAVVWTVVLVGIAIELYRIDRSLWTLSAPMREIDRDVAIETERRTHETPEQTKARLAKEREQQMDEALSRIFTGVEAPAKGLAPARRSAARPAPSPAKDTARTPEGSR